jgi:hypothetical protein
MSCDVKLCEPEALREGAQCTLRDISFGGFGFESNVSLAEDKICQFLIDLRVSGLGPTRVKARIRWARPAEDRYFMGAEFLESSQGWFGPEEDPLEE